MRADLQERVRAEESEFEKKGTYVSEFFVQAIADNLSDGYSFLDGEIADKVAERILNQVPL